MLIVAIIAILAGFYKEYVCMLVLLIIHELGHFLCAKIFGIHTQQILLYPLGGLSKMELDISEDYKKELLIILMGPLFQCVAYLILKFIFTNEQDLIQQIHFGILSFNLLPIYPLDGGKILNIFLNGFTTYRKSFQISIVMSYLFTILLLFSHKKMSINMITIYCVLLFLIYQEELKGKLYFQKFLLERLLKEHPYKKYKIIYRIKDMYRYKYNLLKKGNQFIKERDFLLQKYNKFRKNY